MEEPFPVFDYIPWCHFNQHNNELKCEKCNETILNIRSILRLHLLEEHNYIDQNDLNLWKTEKSEVFWSYFTKLDNYEIECNMCKITMKHFGKLKQHTLEKHPEILNEIEQVLACNTLFSKNFIFKNTYATCIHCNKKFDIFDEYLNVTLTCHATEHNNVTKSSEVQETMCHDDSCLDNSLIYDSFSVLARCNNCDKEFRLANNREDLENHIILFHFDKLLQIQTNVSKTLTWMSQYIFFEQFNVFCRYCKNFKYKIYYKNLEKELKYHLCNAHNIMESSEDDKKIKAKQIVKEQVQYAIEEQTQQAEEDQAQQAIKEQMQQAKEKQTQQEMEKQIQQEMEQEQQLIEEQAQEAKEKQVQELIFPLNKEILILYEQTEDIQQIIEQIPQLTEDQVQQTIEEQAQYAIEEQTQQAKEDQAQQAIKEQMQQTEEKQIQQEMEQQQQLIEEQAQQAEEKQVQELIFPLNKPILILYKCTEEIQQIEQISQLTKDQAQTIEKQVQQTKERQTQREMKEQIPQETKQLRQLIKKQIREEKKKKVKELTSFLNKEALLLQKQTKEIHTTEQICQSSNDQLQQLQEKQAQQTIEEQAQCTIEEQAQQAKKEQAQAIKKQMQQAKKPVEQIIDKSYFDNTLLYDCFLISENNLPICNINNICKKKFRFHYKKRNLEFHIIKCHPEKMFEIRNNVIETLNWMSHYIFIKGFMTSCKNCPHFKYKLYKKKLKKKLRKHLWNTHNIDKSKYLKTVEKTNEVQQQVMERQKEKKQKHNRQ